MPIRLLRSALLALAVAGSLAAATPVAADCQMAGPLAAELQTAPVAFVGRVTATEGSAAQFTVAEVWAGDVGREVEIRGLTDRADPPLGAQPIAPPEPIISEDDRTWTVGATYLVLPVVDGAVLRDHICTATSEWVPELAELRPAGARVLAPGADADVAPLPLIIVLAGLGMLGLISLVAFRREEPRAASR